MAKNLGRFGIDDFGGGLNTSDNSLVLQNNGSVIANNIKYITRPDGKSEAKSINGIESQCNDIYVNGEICTKVLGAVDFNNLPYIMASNDTNARIMYKGSAVKSITSFADGGVGTVIVNSASHGFQDGYSITIAGTTSYNGTYIVSSADTDDFKITATWDADDTGTATSSQFIEAASTNFNADNKVSFAVYNSVLWFVNNTTDNSNVLHFLSTSNTLTGLTAVDSGLPATLSNIILHLERIWIASANSLYVSKMYPQAVKGDWDASSAYVGAAVPGVIQIDRDTEDSIQGLVINFSQLVILRKYSLWLLTGAIISQSEITKRTNVRTGVVASSSISKADKTIYIYTEEGVKTFTGVTVQEGTTQFDSISTITIDEPIRDYVQAFSDDSLITGYAFKDKYYMSDSSSVIFVYDELADNKRGAWSRWTETGADVFFEKSGSLYVYKAEKYYKLDSSTTASVTSQIRTKDFDCGEPMFWKRFHKAIFTFARLADSANVTIYWHLDGASSNSGSTTVNILQTTLAWDAGYQWDQAGIFWDAGTLTYLAGSKRWLRSGVTIAFTIEATGTNRFSVGRCLIEYEKLKKEVV